MAIVLFVFDDVKRTTLLPAVFERVRINICEELVRAIKDKSTIEVGRVTARVAPQIHHPGHDDHAPIGCIDPFAIAEALLGSVLSNSFVSLTRRHVD